MDKMLVLYQEQGYCKLQFKIKLDNNEPMFSIFDKVLHDIPGYTDYPIFYKYLQNRTEPSTSRFLY